ncbi:hypothetical protein [Silvibacterium dinghuense]|uniref:HEAT repeat domain-containing protein n=1 Tax=Silvibacterium dinghuense TaxID=1560006 RepID=A0A4Q1SHV9_9BACT|nr:hypothetical protein [Silvibacterium dinghuense]RXS97181.1 hypothetical protein ESZ00_04505 [Silvibacterium dinghuense]GGG96893.1 hypothetical protein GCM10011586_10150 [Silvibacterium dinghuense]
MSGRKPWSALEGIPLRELLSELKGEDLDGVKSAMIARALASAVQGGEDWKQAQDACLAALASPHPPVRRAAAVCLGELAALRRRMDIAVVRQALTAACEDAAVADAAQTSLHALDRAAS